MLGMWRPSNAESLGATRNTKRATMSSKSVSRRTSLTILQAQSLFVRGVSGATYVAVNNRLKSRSMYHTNASLVNDAPPPDTAIEMEG